ncbi:MAG TPA: septum formation initiator family protein [Nevskiaceae bacterium]|nr:septum formation initiator family protein [Nevskiaceae bacterium]
MRKKLAIAVLGLMLAGLQLRLWVGEGGIAHTQRLRAQLAIEQAELDRLRSRNAALDAEVQDLNSGQAAIEARARHTLGMIQPDETFFLVVEAP